ncbi:MAG: DNA starvation/stationary phase protection protein [Rickettsiales bacterium]|jgi:starvation-inducible DNA-binding protein|nr:DNA starvation/stationary phase protection protein [Rickettsiales bacterium]
MSNKLIAKLELLLSNSYALTIKTQNYHWNVVGSNFVALHQLFGDQYQELFTAIDEIAERIRSFGILVEADFLYFSQNSQITAPKKSNNAEQMVADLAKGNQIIIENLLEAIKVAQDNKDEGTADLFIRRIQVHQKALWMLQSINQ